jgi:DNA-binding NarL/FixJ family response regulator
MNRTEQPRVLLVDDNEAILSRATAALSRSCEVVGALTDGRAAIEAVGTLRPDVVVLDISMPGLNGFEVARDLRAEGLPPAIVFLTVHDGDEFVNAAQAAGAVGYVVKPRLASDLAVAVKEARAGRSYVSQRH